jgi:hypothetical protein
MTLIRKRCFAKGRLLFYKLSSNALRRLFNGYRQVDRQ